MPSQWNPGISYHGDQFIAQTGQNIAGDISQALQRYEEDKKRSEMADGIFSTIQGDPVLKKFVPTEALERWHAMNPDKKWGTLGGITARAKEESQRADDKRQQQAVDQALRIAQMHDKTQRDIAAMKDPATSDPTHIDPYTDPVTGEKVPGVGIVRKTGGVVYTGGMSGGIQVEKDPQTGAFFYRDPKGTPHAVTMPAITGGAAATALNPNAGGGAGNPVATAVPAGKVRVKDKSGKIGLIPAGQLQDALTQGYTQVQ
jgi:hypothetical protein